MTLTRVQRAAVALHLEGHTALAIADALHVSERTVRTWLNSTPEVQAELERQRELLERDDWVGIVLSCLATATRGSVVDWPSRLRAAELLRNHEINRPPTQDSVKVTISDYRLPQAGE